VEERGGNEPLYPETVERIAQEAVIPPRISGIIALFDSSFKP